MHIHDLLHLLEDMGSILISGMAFLNILNYMIVMVKALSEPIYSNYLLFVRSYAF